MNRRALCPKHYADWLEALKQPLTYEHALYLQGGKLKEREHARALAQRIADYVVDTFNAQAERVRTCSPEDIVFAIRHFIAEFRKLFFFRPLSFMAEKDKKAIVRSVTDAATDLSVFLTEKFGETDPEILFVRNDLRRTIKTETV